MGQIRDRMQQDLERGGYAAATITHYLACVLTFVGFYGGRSPLRLGQSEIRSFIVHLEKRELSGGRVRQFLAALKFLYARTLGRPHEVAWIVFPPKKKRMPPILSGSEVKSVLDAIKSPTYHAIASVCYGAGLRSKEARLLEVADVWSQQGLLHVRHGKGGHERFAMLSPALLRTLRSYWKAVRPCGPLLLPSPHTGRALSSTSVCAAVKAAGVRAGIRKRVTPHLLRHSFATHLLEMGIEMRVIQQLLGHASIQSTSFYAQVTSSLVRRTQCPLDVLDTPEAKLLG